MTTRRLCLARHGVADAFGELTETGHRQANLLGRRLAGAPIDVIWHSPLPRAAASAQEVANHLPDVPIIEAPELVDHVPYVPPIDETPSQWLGFFDGYDDAEAQAGHQTAATLIARYGTIAATPQPSDTHEVLITHAYPIAWLLRDAMDAPPARWLGLDSANAALTVIDHRSGLPPTVLMFNEMSHLPADLQWTGTPGPARTMKRPRHEAHEIRPSRRWTALSAAGARILRGAPSPGPGLPSVAQLMRYPGISENSA